MTDRREIVMARLAILAAGVSGVTKVARNQEEITGLETGAAVVIWEGDEAVATEAPHRRPPNAPMMIETTAEVQIKAGRPSETIGSTLNAIRAALIKAILQDALDSQSGVPASLGAAVVTNGSVKCFNGSTALARGRAMQGSVSLGCMITYPLILSEL